MITRVAPVLLSIPWTSLLNCITAAVDVMMSRNVDRARGEAMRNKNWLAMIVVVLIGKKA